MYNVLASDKQHNDSVIHIYVCVYIYIFFFRFFSLTGYYTILRVVPCATQ